MERYNVSTLLDDNLEAGRGDKVALRAGDEQLTYAELLTRTCQVANALELLGLQREQRLLMICDDTAAFPATFLGAIRLGAVPVPVNPMAKAADYRYFLEDSYARVLVADATRLDVLREALDGYDKELQVIVVGDDSAVAQGIGRAGHGFDDLVGQHPEERAPADTHPDDMAFWLYSSGSTGRPKGVVHYQQHVPYTCEHYAGEVLGMTAEDVTFSTTKLFHAYGLGNNLTFPYWAGATTVLSQGRPVPEAILESAQRHRPSLFFSVPTLYNAMLNSPGAADVDLSSVRLCVSAAEALPREVYKRWHDTYGLVILDGIGSTEMLHIFCSNTPGDVTPGSSGRPVPGYELKLLDYEGQTVADGETGNLFVRGGSAFAFYWHQRAKTKATVLGDWIAGGDRYRRDAEGHYWYEGRADDMMKVGGLWVSPIEIENTLVEHVAVSEAAVVVAHVDGLAKIKAFVTCRPGSTGSDTLASELQEWCKQRLQRYQYPHFVEFCEDLPKTATGKIQRYKLREQAEETTS